MHYVANRIDADVQFTYDACKQLTQIPRPFLKDALNAIVERALKDGVELVDENYLATIRR